MALVIFIMKALKYNELVYMQQKLRNLERGNAFYFGLFLMFTEIFGVRFYFLSLMDMPDQVFKQSNAMLEYFIFTWGGLSTVYVGGRTYEKRKMKLFQKSKE